MLQCKLKLFREKQNLSQRMLSKISRISQAEISNIENLKKIPALSTIDKLAKALDICPKSLIYCDKIDCQYNCDCCKQALK